MISNSQQIISVLRWKWYVFLDKTGRWSIILFSVPLILTVCLTSILLPKIDQTQNAIYDLQQQMRSPLPLEVDDEHVLATELSVTEYQQIKVMFDLFEKYHLHVESGNYRFQAEDDQHAQALILAVPLRGKWLNLVQALQDISRALPIELDRIQISRPSPETDMLSITLQLTLHRGQ
ncbi:hypothetical protein ACSN7O_004630 [Enterobacter chuandaensis]